MLGDLSVLGLVLIDCFTDVGRKSTEPQRVRHAFYPMTGDVDDRPGHAILCELLEAICDDGSNFWGFLS